MKNVPYVKEFLNGQLQNPIEGKYVNQGENRSLRRSRLNQEMNNRSKSSTIVSEIKGQGTYAYKRTVQYVLDKCIVHYHAKTKRNYSIPTT
mgnify:CR=1 FL=1